MSGKETIAYTGVTIYDKYQNSEYTFICILADNIPNMLP